MGHWDGDALVVETTRLNEPYLDNTGAPMGPQAKLVERFAPTADGRMYTEVRGHDLACS